MPQLDFCMASLPFWPQIVGASDPTESITCVILCLFKVTVATGMGNSVSVSAKTMKLEDSFECPSEGHTSEI